MKKIIIIVVAILIARSCLSQLATPPQYNQWKTSNSYIAGGSVAVLGTILCMATKSPIEITPQAGPAINRLRPDKELGKFLEENGSTSGTLWGYSAGSTICLRRRAITYKSGLFVESKGGSYSYSYQVNMTDNQGNLVLMGINQISTTRLNYLTIPLTIGVQTKWPNPDSSKTRISFDVGGFISLPISESHQTTYNGIKSTMVPMYRIGPDGGLMADVGIKIPMTNRIDFAIDARFLCSLSDAMKLLQIGKSFNQSTQLLFGLNIKLN